jgi:hypothetical protein
MKTIFNFPTTKKLSILSITFTLLTLFISSCTKSSYTGLPNAVDVGNLPQYGFVMAVNAAEISTVQSLYLNNVKITTTALAYTATSGYISAAANVYQAAFESVGKNAIDSPFGLSILPGQYSTAFYTDDFTTTLLQDDMTLPQAGKARVRFINLSAAESTSVDFKINGVTNLITGLQYKAPSAYFEVDPSASFSLYLSSPSTFLLDIPASFQATHVYTVFISGASSATVSYHILQQI